MSEAYKKFTAQDYAVIPFNAHKQYNFISQSAHDNQIRFYNVSWTSESISQYSSASSAYGGDTKETVKYNQLDHNFYKNFKNDTFNRLGYNNYLIHKRELYERAQLISIPAGLYGHEIKPGSFYLSSSKSEIIDDSHGNLIVSGTNMDHYPSDIRKNVFRLDPIKGFKAYDLDTFPGYAVKLSDPQNSEVGMTKRFWRRGVKNPNITPNYTTNTKLSETDDSYYFNPFKYNKVEFDKSILGYSDYNYSSINFDSIKGSHIVSPHNDKFNFNDEDFAISFWMKPSPLGSSILQTSESIGIQFGGGTVYAVDSDYIYIISNSPIGSYWPVGVNAWEWGPQTTNNGSGVGNIQTGNGGTTPAVGDGYQQTQNIINADGGANANNIGYLAGAINNHTHNGYTDWYVPTLTEIHTAVTNLDIFNPNGVSYPSFSNIDASLLEDSQGGSTITNQLLTSTEGTTINQYLVYQSGSLTGVATAKNITTTGIGVTTTLPVRRVPKLPHYYDNTKRYIICKSGTQTVIPSDLSPGSQMTTNTSTTGSLQSLNVLAQPQFPFEIYMQSSSLYFARSDGDTIFSISGEVTGSDGNVGKLTHILCQKSASRMEIHFDGNLISSASDILKQQTRNLANLYIGSKGSLSKKDANNTLGDTAFYNGSLSCINIFNNSFNTASIKNISESINASPYVGNIFYQNGFASITKPNKQDLELPSTKNSTFNVANTQMIKRLLPYNYENAPSNAFHDQSVTSRMISLDFNDDGTRLYTLSDGTANAGQNNALNPNEDPNRRIYQFNLSTPYDLHSADLDGDNTGAGSYLTGNPEHALDASASYATISSSLKDLFCDATQLQLKPDGTGLFIIGNGYINLSGSAHPGSTDWPLQEWTGNPNTAADYVGKYPSKNRFLGGVVEIPLTTPWSIVSGSGGSMDFENAKLATLDYTYYHSHIDAHNAGNVVPTGPHTKIIRGQNPTAFQFNSDGTRMYTAHRQNLQKGLSPGQWWHTKIGPYEDYYNAGNLGTSFVIEEWILNTAYDVSSIQYTGEYVYSDQHTNSARLGLTTTDITEASAFYKYQRYGKVGKTLDLSTLNSPEGYPITVRGIHFSGQGTKMWLASLVTSISLPLGVRWDVGGHGINFTDPSWAASAGLTGPSADGEKEGGKIWEYDLLVPYDITTAQYVRTTNLSEPDGVLEHANPQNDDFFTTTGQAQLTCTDSAGGPNGFKWHPDGESIFFSTGFGRVIVEAGNPLTTYPLKIQFQGSHMIWEHEYQCTIDEHEFNDTLNISARKLKTSDSHELADFTTGSLFKPYITTVGLYDENNELLVVGKMGQPVRASDETDTTIILRWDS